MSEAISPVSWQPSCMSLNDAEHMQEIKIFLICIPPKSLPTHKALSLLLQRRSALHHFGGSLFPCTFSQAVSEPNISFMYT